MDITQLTFDFFKSAVKGTNFKLQLPLVFGWEVLQTVLFFALVFLVLHAPVQLVSDHLESTKTIQHILHTVLMLNVSS